MSRYTDPVPYDKMSERELQVELDKLAPDIARSHDHYVKGCGWLYCRLATRVKRELERRAERKKYRASFPAGTSFCCCGCRCDNETGPGESGYCRQCQEGRCGE